MKKLLKKTEWPERLTTLSSGNRGANALLEEAGENIAENLPFRNIEYDPVGKGDDLVIALGESDSSMRHVVQAPAEIYLNQTSDGELTSIEISNSAGVVSKLRFL